MTRTGPVTVCAPPQPAVMDACFQAVKGGQRLKEEHKASDYFFLPAAIRRVRLYTESVPDTLFASARLVSESEEAVLSDRKLCHAPPPARKRPTRIEHRRVFRRNGDEMSGRGTCVRQT